MDELLKTWWFGGVIFPLTTSVLTGVLTGLAVSRYLMFYQEVQRAKEEVLNLFNIFKMLTIDSLMAAQKENHTERVAWLLLKPVITLNSQGHLQASERMHAIAQEMQPTYIDLWRPVHFKVKNSAPLDGILDQYAKNGAQVLNTFIFRLDQLRPNILALLFGRKVTLTITNQLSAKKIDYLAFTEHLETGAPLTEIRARLRKN